MGRVTALWPEFQSASLLYVIRSSRLSSCWVRQRLNPWLMLGLGLGLWSVMGPVSALCTRISVCITIAMLVWDLERRSFGSDDGFPVWTLVRSIVRPPVPSFACLPAAERLDFPSFSSEFSVSRSTLLWNLPLQLDYETLKCVGLLTFRNLSYLGIKLSELTSCALK